MMRVGTTHHVVGTDSIHRSHSAYFWMKKEANPNTEVTWMTGDPPKAIDGALLPSSTWPLLPAQTVHLHQGNCLGAFCKAPQQRHHLNMRNKARPHIPSPTSTCPEDRRHTHPQ